MCLDRKDPTQAYLKKNVVPSCKTCNKIKSDIPMKAWLHILPAVRSAIRKDLLQ